MANSAKDKAFHANGTMTHAEYKRRFLNKKAVARGTAQVEIRGRAAFLTGENKMTTKDKARLRNVCIRQEPIPGTFYKPENIAAPSLRQGRATAHIRTSI